MHEIYYSLEPEEKVIGLSAPAIESAIGVLLKDLSDQCRVGVCHANWITIYYSSDIRKKIRRRLNGKELSDEDLPSGIKLKQEHIGKQNNGGARGINFKLPDLLSEDIVIMIQKFQELEYSLEWIIDMLNDTQRQEGELIL